MDDQGEKRTAREKLIALLQHACSGELAAALAYHGHWKSLRRENERLEVRRIEEDELHHRARIIEMLANLGAEPLPALERRLRRIGRVIAALCRIGGWFIPMYGAGRLEYTNIAEYERAARHAWLSDNRKLVDELLGWAEVEWDHEKYFRDKVNSHFLRHLVPMRKSPPPRESIRSSFDAFSKNSLKVTETPAPPARV